MSEEIPSLAKQIAHAALAVDEARGIHAELQREMEAARRAETDALNALNTAQREFDKLVKRLRSESPAHSDWKRPMSAVGAQP